MAGMAACNRVCSYLLILSSSDNLSLLFLFFFLFLFLSLGVEAIGRREQRYGGLGKRGHARSEGGEWWGVRERGREEEGKRRTALLLILCLCVCVQVQCFTEIDRLGVTEHNYADLFDQVTDSDTTHTTVT